jgi:hypothetical protein
MAICGKCQAESARVRSRWDAKTGAPLPDECPNCSPGSFEKFTAPSDKKMWGGWEAHPNEYEKRYDSEGVFYLRKPEYRAEQEAQLALGATDEREKQARAEIKKRAERRTLPMNSAEQAAAIAKASQIAEWITESAKEGTQVC